MRLDIRIPDVRNEQYKVYLDGEYQTNAIMADDELGVVLRDVLIEGRLVVLGNEILQEFVYGKIEFRRIENAIPIS